MSVITRLSNTKRIVSSPFESILDWLIAIVLKLVFPLPVPQIVIAQFRVPMVAFLVSIVVIILMFFTLAATVVLSPVLLGKGIIETITSTLKTANELNIPVDTSYAHTSIPRQNPLGGAGMTFTEVTAYFLNPDYYLQFGRNHTGLDLIPSEAYFNGSPTYKEFKKVIVYSTINGTASHYVDQYGGETVEIVNKDVSMKIIFIHFSQVLIEPGEVIAGTPLGVMGMTGFATGEHVHYEVRVKDGDIWQPVNPLNYIN